MLLSTKTTAEPWKRIKRGLYVDGQNRWNADCAGAFNILRLYFARQKIKMELNPLEIKTAVCCKSSCVKSSSGVMDAPRICRAFARHSDARQFNYRVVHNNQYM